MPSLGNEHVLTGTVLDMMDLTEVVPLSYLAAESERHHQSHVYASHSKYGFLVDCTHSGSADCGAPQEHNVTRSHLAPGRYTNVVILEKGRRRVAWRAPHYEIAPNRPAAGSFTHYVVILAGSGCKQVRWRQWLPMECPRNAPRVPLGISRQLRRAPDKLFSSAPSFGHLPRNPAA